MASPVKMVRIDGKLVIVPVSDSPPKDKARAVGPATIQATPTKATQPGSLKKKKAKAVGPATIQATPTRAAKPSGLKEKKVKPVAGKKGTPAKVAVQARGALRSRPKEVPPVKPQLRRSVTPSTFSASLRSSRSATDRREVKPALRRSVSVGRSAPSSGRAAAPILRRVARAVSGPLKMQSMELASYELPDHPEPPPRIRELEILTTRDLDAIVEGDGRQKNTISDYQACDLTRELSQEALEFLVQRAPDMKIVSLYNCRELREILCLRKLLKIEVLYLGELPGVDT